jgi:hypothetical protein
MLYGGPSTLYMEVAAEIQSVFKLFQNGSIFAPLLSWKRPSAQHTFLLDKFSPRCNRKECMNIPIPSNHDRMIGAPGTIALK